jgi:carboxylesterase type B
VRDASRFGQAAPQNTAIAGPLLSLGIGRTGEDCLYLNVWTPRADRARRPVLVWIHGGAFVLGAGSQTLYDGAALARRGDVVVVTLNYRMGALGFLRLRERFGDRLPATGNEGLLDQVAALRWVRDEIEAFGGDPGNVTIFGESAGAMSCATLLGMPQVRGLFHRAILQSGAANFRWPPDVAAGLADLLLEDLGLGSPEALREAHVSSLLDAQRRLFMNMLLSDRYVLGALSPGGQRVAGAVFLGLALARRRFGSVAAPLSARLLTLLRRRRRDGTPSPHAAALHALRTRGLPFQPVVDGAVVPRDPLEAVRDGAARDVPLLIGTNLDETRLFLPLDPEAATLDEASLLARCRDAIPGKNGERDATAREAIEVYRAARAARGERIEPGCGSPSNPTGRCAILRWRWPGSNPRTSGTPMRTCSRGRRRPWEACWAPATRSTCRSSSARSGTRCSVPSRARARRRARSPSECRTRGSRSRERDGRITRGSRSGRATRSRAAAP